MTWLCVFGDSISQGYYDSEHMGWVNRTILSSWKKNIHIGNHSVSGGTTVEALKIMKPIFRAEWPKGIIFALGGNDARFTTTTNDNFVPLKEFSANIKKLIKLALMKLKLIYMLKLRLIFILKL